MTEKTFVSDDGQVLRGEPVSITDLLAQFRAKLEQETEAPLEALDLNAALLLSDLCNHLGLFVQHPERQRRTAENHDRALGDQAAAFVRRVQEQRPRLRLPAQMLIPPAGDERA